MLIALAVLPFFSTLLVATAVANLLPEGTALIGTGANPVLPGAAVVLAIRTVLG